MGEIWLFLTIEITITNHSMNFKITKSTDYFWFNNASYFFLWKVIPRKDSLNIDRSR